MKTKPKGFLVYYDSLSLLERLSKAECGRVMCALGTYGRTGKEQVPKLTKAAYMTYLFMKGQLERDAEKYDAIVKRNRINGAKGGKATQKGKALSKIALNVCEQSVGECKPSQANTNTNTDTSTNTSTNTDTSTSISINTGTSENTTFLTNAGVGSAVPSAPPEAATGENDTHTLKRPYGSLGNVFLTQEEYARLVAEHPQEYEKAIAHLDEYIAGSGKRPSDHYYALTSWVFTALRERAIKEEELALREKRIEKQRADIADKNHADSAEGRLDFDLNDFFEKPV